MKKSRKIILLNVVLIVCICCVLVGAYKIHQKDDLLEMDGVTYAINVNGSKTDSIPARGNYRVDVDCTNSTSKWDYTNWELNVDNVRGNVACKINFVTIENVPFSQYVMNLAGTKQGNGSFVHEQSSTSVPDYSKAVALTQSEYGSYTTYSSANDAFESSGAAHSGTALTFSDGKWVTNKSIFPNWQFNHFKFDINDDGFYEVCYNYGSATTNNRLWIYSGESSILESLNAINGSAQNDCVGVGYIASGSYIKVVVTSIGSSTRPDLSFDFRKVPDSAIGSETIDADYRYEGKNPNNYVWFNDELWRIIGVFDSSSHGQADVNLVKLIKDNSLNAYVYNTTADNTWGTSAIKDILNTTYYNGASTNSKCYGFSTDSTTANLSTTCDFSGIGLKSYYKDMIANASWKWSGAANPAVSAGEMYKEERQGSKTPVTAKVGLMYASDYGFSVLEDDCSRSYGLNSYSSGTCASSSWLTGNNWTMSTASTNNAYSFQIDYNGSMMAASVRKSAQIKPSVYLNSSIFYIDGDGSATNPYIVGK